MRIFKCCLFLLLNAALLPAQVGTSFSVRQSRELDAGQVLGCAVSPSGTYAYVNIKGGTCMLTTLDSGLRPLHEVKLYGPSSGRNTRFLKAVWTPHGISVFYSEEAQRSGKTIYYLAGRIINTHSWQLSENPFPLDSGLEQKTYRFAASPSGNHILINFQGFWKKGLKAQVFTHLLLADDWLEVEWRRTVADVSSAQCSVSEQGNVLMCASMSEITGAVQGQSINPAFRYQLFYWDREKKDSIDRPIVLKDAIPTNCCTGFLPGGKFYVTGYYKPGVWWSGPTGVFFMQYGREPVLGKFRYDSLFSMVDDTPVNKKAEKNGNPVNGLVNLKALCTDDGHIYLVAEQFFATLQIPETDDHPEVNENVFYVEQLSEAINNSGNPPANFTCTFGNILVTRLDSTGRQEWSVRVPHRLDPQGMGWPFSSFVPLVSDEKLCLLMYDDPGNLLTGADLKRRIYTASSLSASVPVVVEVGANGRQKRNPLYGPDSGDKICPRTWPWPLVYHRRILLDDLCFPGLVEVNFGE